MRKIWILMCIALLVFAVGCKKEQPAPAPAPAPAPEPTPVVTEPTPVVPEVPTAYVGKTEVISDVVCKDGVVSGTLTNVARDSVVLGADMKVLIRGMNVKDLVCDKTELKKGESTVCSSLNGRFQMVPGKNEVAVRVIESNDVIATVNCE